VIDRWCVITDAVDRARQIAARHRAALTHSPTLCLTVCLPVSPGRAANIPLAVSMSTSPASGAAVERCGRPVSFKDRGGQWLCLLCPKPTRITKERDSRPWGPQGRAHEKCIKREIRRGIKRSASSDGAEQQRPRPSQPSASAAVTATATATAATPAAASSFPHLNQTASPRTAMVATTDEQQRFHAFGYARMSSTARSRALAWRLLQVSHRSNSNSTIAGNVKQLELDKLKETRELQDEWIAVVRETAAAVGISGVDRLFVVDSKLLIAAPKHGQQPVHFDCARERSAGDRHSFILICSNGCYSTALPRFPANDALSFSHTEEDMQREAHLLHESHYESLPATAGDIILFRQSTPHFGVQNAMPQGNRVVLFGMLSPSNAPGQDAEQVFPWLFVGAAFGWKSKKFATALVEGRQHQPVRRISQDSGETAGNLAYECLRRWNLFDLYSS